jgi:hypothetical protein
MNGDGGDGIDFDEGALDDGAYLDVNRQEAGDSYIETGGNDGQFGFSAGDEDEDGYLDVDDEQ